MRAASVSRRTAETESPSRSRSTAAARPRSRPVSASSITCWSNLRATASSTSTSKATGDLHVDQHHTDGGHRHRARPGLPARRSATSRGITRYADVAPAHGRDPDARRRRHFGPALLVFRTAFPSEKIGDFDTELVREWFQAFAHECRADAPCARPIRRQQPPYRRKPASREWREPCVGPSRMDPREEGRVPSTKGTL